MPLYLVTDCPTESTYTAIRGTMVDTDSVKVTIFEDGKELVKGKYNIKTNWLHLDSDIDEDLEDYLVYAIETRQIELE